MDLFLTCCFLLCRVVLSALEAFCRYADLRSADVTTTIAHLVLPLSAFDIAPSTIVNAANTVLSLLPPHITSQVTQEVTSSGNWGVMWEGDRAVTATLLDHTAGRHYSDQPGHGCSEITAWIERGNSLDSEGGVTVAAHGRARPLNTAAARLLKEADQCSQWLLRRSMEQFQLFDVESDEEEGSGERKGDMRREKETEKDEDEDENERGKEQAYDHLSV